jgi:DNA repair protein RecN (Recombination protein N)
VLSELHIEHLGVIERVQLRLGPGTTAVTGETGAGKTMLVEALELLVGGRADASIVRPGAREARVDGRFVVGDDEIVLTRVVPADGRSRAYVDGRPATVTALAEIAGGIVELHGQHAHQSLLSGTTQRDALDQFGRVDLGPLRAARANVAELDAELAALGGDERARAREIDLLRFQVAELDAAGVEDPREDESLEVEEDALADATGHRAAAAATHAALAEEGGARDALASGLGAIGARAPFRELTERLGSLLAEVDDVAAEIHRIGDGIEDDPARLDAVRQRRQLLRDLRRKYGEDLAEVVRFRHEAARRLAELERFDERAAELDTARAAALAAVRRAAAAVGRARRAAAPALAGAVTDRLRTLALAHAELVVDTGDGDGDPAAERVQFLFTANPGSPLLPLTKVASGGELARAMLALRLVLTGADGSSGNSSDSTYVFDEVDAGIGGTSASAVGAALAEVGRHHQVLVVTHLAQVAAQADAQLVVTKQIAGHVTTTDVALADGAQRVDELARMLSGEEGGEAARRHAAELLGRH